jgi:hypothetical protein
VSYLVFCAAHGSDSKSILKIPDDTFRWFVQCLDESQGVLIREISAATSEIVTAIFRGTLDPSKRFGIEQLEHEEIIRHPRGSPLILRYLSMTGPNTINAARFMQS